MITRTCKPSRRTVVLTVMVLGVLTATMAAAQSTTAPPTIPVATTARSTAQAGAPAAGAPFWELIGGVEADTHGSSYSFFGPAYTHPIRPDLAWTVRLFPNFLAYEFTSAGGTTKVRSPGVATMAGLKFGEKNFFHIGVGPEVKFRRTTVVAANGTETETTDTRVGVSAGAEVYANPSARNNVHGQVNYNTSDRYTWGRLGFKQQVNNYTWQGPNTFFLGVEGIGQGNRDIKSAQVGGFVEVNHVPASVSMMFKAGYKRSTFPVGPSKTGPYFAVTFYKRLQ